MLHAASSSHVLVPPGNANHATSGEDESGINDSRPFNTGAGLRKKILRKLTNLSFARNTRPA